MSISLVWRPPAPDKHYKKAQDFLDKGQINEAIREFKKSLQTTPGHYSTLFNIATCYGVLEQYEESVKWSEIAIRTNPDDDKIWFNKALVLKKLKRYEEALESIDRSLEIGKYNENTWILKGNILGHLGDLQNSIVCFDKVLAINPHNSLARQNKICSLERLGLIEDIKKTQEEGELLDKDNPQLIFLKGLEYYKVKRYKEASDLFDKSLRLDPYNPTYTQYNYLALKKIREIDELLNWRPITINNWFEKSTKLSDLGRYEEVIKCSDKILEIDPNQEIAIFNKGVSLIKLGSDAEGMIYIKKAEDMNPNNPKILTSIGAINYDKGNYNEAIKYYEKALKIDPNYSRAIEEKNFALNKLGIKEFVFCAKCGSKNKYSNNFCLNCGCKLVKLNPKVSDITKQL